MPEYLPFRLDTWDAGGPQQPVSTDSLGLESGIIFVTAGHGGSPWRAAAPSAPARAQLSPQSWPHPVPPEGLRGLQRGPHLEMEAQVGMSLCPHVTPYSWQILGLEPRALGIQENLTLRLAPCSLSSDTGQCLQGHVPTNTLRAPTRTPRQAVSLSRAPAGLELSLSPQVQTPSCGQGPHRSCHLARREKGCSTSPNLAAPTTHRVREDLFRPQGPPGPQLLALRPRVPASAPLGRPPHTTQHNNYRRPRRCRALPAPLPASCPDP